MFLALALAISFTPDNTIWSWTQLKFEFLLQATPVFVFGLYSARMKSTPALAGMFVGCATAVGIYVASISIPFGLNAGLVGLAVNSVVLVGGSYTSGRDEETERASAILEYNSIEFPSEPREAEYVLPAQRKVFWVGLAVVLALLVPWYAPESWNAQTAFGLPIWVWVTLGSVVLETLFVVFGTLIWQKQETPTSTSTERAASVDND